MKTIDIPHLCVAAMFTAIICVATSALKIPVVVTNGYIHLGDIFILAASAALGPLAVLPAALGSALADLLAGYPMYILPTLLIKGLMGLVAGLFIGKPITNIANKNAKSGTNYIILAAVLVSAELVMTIGYFLAECVMYEVKGAALAIPMNLLQGLFGVVGGMLIIRFIPKSILRDIL